MARPREFKARVKLKPYRDRVCSMLGSMAGMREALEEQATVGR